VARTKRAQGSGLRGQERSLAPRSTDPWPQVPGPYPPEEPPPIGRSWPTLYAIVAGALLFWIALFAAFTWAFR